MTLSGIKAAISEGRIVHWSTNAYRVIHHCSGEYYIIYYHNNSCVNLVDSEGKLVENELDFYTEGN